MNAKDILKYTQAGMVGVNRILLNYLPRAKVRKVMCSRANAWYRGIT
jgi:hypothetical protein